MMPDRDPVEFAEQIAERVLPRLAEHVTGLATRNASSATRRLRAGLQVGARLA